MELVEKFDNKRRELNKTTERYLKIPGEYGLATHVWIKNAEGQYLIQKRSATKKVLPNYWSITGGGTDAGETTYDTLIRECKEELNIDVNTDNVELMLSLKRENDFLDVWLLKVNTIKLEDLTLQEEEVSDVKWATVYEIKEMMKDGKFSPNIEIYFDTFLNMQK